MMFLLGVLHLAVVRCSSVSEEHEYSSHYMLQTPERKTSSDQQ